MADDNQAEQPQQTASQEPIETRPRTASRRMSAPKMPQRTTGKSSNPEYEPVKVYVRSEMRKKAVRKWEDECGRDLSDLIEVLFSKYLNS
jgi:hypothetical protein